jgi:hypothetical protein
MPPPNRRDAAMVHAGDADLDQAAAFLPTNLLLLWAEAA